MRPREDPPPDEERFGSPSPPPYELVAIRDMAPAEASVRDRGADRPDTRLGVSSSVTGGQTEDIGQRDNSLPIWRTWQFFARQHERTWAPAPTGAVWPDRAL